LSNITDGEVRMYNPPHPGEVLRELYLDPLGLSVTDTAQAIGVSRTALSQIVNGRARLSVEMAARLAQAFRTTIELWLRMQLAHDVWQAGRKKPRVRVRPLVRKQAAAG
jgi:addiction module HigA family antidote